jgi:glycosyltransferase involved in cell wall biosynthesis
LSGHKPSVDYRVTTSAFMGSSGIGSRPRNSAEGHPFPKVDVIIPTFNCARRLRTCLESLRNQTWNKAIDIVAIDGGSTDGTQSIVKQYGVRLVVNPGQYATGANGARRFGELNTHGDFVWNIDSDNIVIEPTALADLLAPMLADPSINISMPQLSTIGSSSSISRWATQLEMEKIRRLMRRSLPVGRNYVTDDLDYGLVNGALLRRTALEAGGGYDSDVRLLRRLRRRSLARAVVVPTAHVGHDFVESFGQYLRKLDSRIIRFADMSDVQLEAFFLDSAVKSSGSRPRTKDLVFDTLWGTVISSIALLQTRNRDWIWGLLYPMVLVTLAIVHPRRSVRVLRRIF